MLKTLHGWENPLRLTRADQSVWQARVSRVPRLEQRQDGSVQMCNKAAKILLLLFSLMPRGDDWETNGCVLSTRGNMASCMRLLQQLRKLSNTKWEIVSFPFCAVSFIECTSSVVGKLTFRLIFLLSLCVCECVCAALLADQRGGEPVYKRNKDTLGICLRTHCDEHFFCVVVFLPPALLTLTDLPFVHTLGMCKRGHFFSLPPPLSLFQPSAPSHQLLHCIYTTLDFFPFFSLLKLPSILIAITPDLKEAEAAGEHSHFLTPLLFVCAVITSAAMCNGVASWMRLAWPQTCLLAAEQRRRKT